MPGSAAFFLSMADDQCTQQIYQGQGSAHPLTVTDEAGLRVLRFGGQERQTCLDPARPYRLQLDYTRAMVLALLLCPQPESFLVLGLGGGALPHFLLHHYPGARIEVVEKEQAVIDLAHVFFGLPRQERLTILHQEASDFLRQSPPATHGQGYQLALVDIFGAGCMAPDLFDPGFYRGLLARLHPQGVIAVNLWSGEAAAYQQALRAVEQGCDGRLLLLPVGKHSNVIVLAFADAIPHAIIKQAAKQGTIHSQRLGIDFAPLFKRLRRANRPTLLSRLFGRKL